MYYFDGNQVLTIAQDYAGCYGVTGGKKDPKYHSRTTARHPGLESKIKTLAARPHLNLASLIFGPNHPKSPRAADRMPGKEPYKSHAQSNQHSNKLAPGIGGDAGAVTSSKGSHSHFTLHGHREAQSQRRNSPVPHSLRGQKYLFATGKIKDLRARTAVFAHG